MLRFWLVLAAAVGCLAVQGCSSRSIEGRWNGPLPQVANMDPCSIRLEMGSSFSFTCSGKVPRQGGGTYTFGDETLVLKIHRLTESGKGVESRFLPEKFDVSGPGNRITLKPAEPGRPIVWTRQAP